MNEQREPRRLDRRRFLRIGAQGAGLLAVGTIAPAAIARIISELSPNSARALRQPRTAAQLQPPPAVPAAATFELRLAATDGFLKLPGRDSLYQLRFVEVPR